MVVKGKAMKVSLKEAPLHPLRYVDAWFDLQCTQRRSRFVPNILFSFRSKELNGADGFRIFDVKSFSYKIQHEPM